MIEADEFLEPVRQRGFDFYTGVPCSFLTPIINRAITNPNLDYVTAASEGEAVAIASGAWLAGRGTAVMMQNSGLGNAVNPLTSLNYPFRIPTLFITTWRAGPGLKDEPQHELMGQITPQLLDLMRIPRKTFPATVEAVEPALDEACSEMDGSGLPFAFVMEKGAVNDCGLSDNPRPATGRGDREDYGDAEAASRFATLERMLSILPEEAAVIATTGKCGRELFTLVDRPQHLYQVGSMGCAAGMGLGVALNSAAPVVVIDGDGALMMKMGTLTTIGACRPSNLIHIVLDNGTYDSTGGQPTVSPGVDFAAAAQASGYARVSACRGLDGFEKALSAALAGQGPTLLHVPIRPGSLDKLGRPTVKPDAVARRFKAFLEEAQP